MSLPRGSTSKKALSARETDIVELIAVGLSQKQIAAELNIGAESVKGYLKRVRKYYRDTGRPAGNTALLTIRAIEDGIVQLAEIAAPTPTTENPIIEPRP